VCAGLAYLAIVVAAAAQLLSLMTGRFQGKGSRAHIAVAGASRAAAAKGETQPAAQARLMRTYGKLPLSFEANQGQTDRRVNFLARGSGYSLFLTGNEAVLALRKSSRQSRVESRTSVAQVGRTSGLWDEVMRQPSSDRSGVPKNPRSVH